MLTRGKYVQFVGWVEGELSVSSTFLMKEAAL